MYVRVLECNLAFFLPFNSCAADDERAYRQPVYVELSTSMSRSCLYRYLVFTHSTSVLGGLHYLPLTLQGSR